MADTSQSLSEVAICNFGAATLDEPAITSLDDPGKYARFCAREYGYIRDELIRLYPWSFAEQYATLAPDETPPPFGFKYAYSIPSNWLRLFPITCNGLSNGPSVHYKKVGRKVYTNYGTVLYVRGLRRVTSPGDFDPLFARALGQMLALRAAENITGKSGYTAKAQQFFNDAMQAATLTDSLERGTPETVENEYGTQDVLAVRGNGYFDAAFDTDF